MKSPHIAIVVLALLALCSCTFVSHPTAGTYASLGGDTEDYNADAGGFHFQKNINSTAFLAAIVEVRKMWANYLLYKGFTFAAGKYYDHKGAELSTSETIELEKLRNARSAQEARAQIKMMESAPVETVPLL